jgi:type I restriction enzyme M protein
MGKERREISENSWIVKVEGIIKRNYDLSARNPNKIKTTTYESPNKIVEEILNREKEIGDLIIEIKKILKNES